MIRTSWRAHSTGVHTWPCPDICFKSRERQAKASARHDVCRQALLTYQYSINRESAALYIAGATSGARIRSSDLSARLILRYRRMQAPVRWPSWAQAPSAELSRLRPHAEHLPRDRRHTVYTR